MRGILLVTKALDGLKLSVLPVSFPVETIVLQSNNNVATDEIRPLLSCVHGGPHGISTTAFSAQVTSFALHGCKLVLSKCIFIII
jgi:acylaminoacyl-peptidase